MPSIAIIPARGGSKRIPRKNVKQFCGRPIITYVIDIARDSGCFDEIMVSTDDSEIADLARDSGATVPFYRSAENSTDQASTDAVLLEVLHKYAERGSYFSFMCCIYPTAVLTVPGRIREGKELLLSDSSLSSVFAVLKYGHPIQRAFKIEKEYAIMLQPELANTRSQELEACYHDAGQWYWLRTERFLDSQTSIMPNSKVIVLNYNEAQDIDNEEDWKLAELKMHLQQGTQRTK